MTKGSIAVVVLTTIASAPLFAQSPAPARTQKRREALAADSVIGAEAIFAPYRDGEIPNDEAARKYVADIIRQVKPTYVITHWSHSIHKDHSNTRIQKAFRLTSITG